MAGIFDKKQFNAEVFAGYVGRIPNTKQNAMIHSRAIRLRPELAAAMKDQDGGHYITTALTGLISGSKPKNYDGVTNMTTDSTETFRHSRVVVGRMNGWDEKDFARDITGGKDFLENVAQQIADYWSEVDQDTLLHILKGIFAMTGTENKAFVDAHTSDITTVTNSNGNLGYMDATSLNSAMQKACGDKKGAFSLAIMHSTVSTNLENMKLLTYLKYTDANGMERELGLGSLNGKTVLIDDDMPTADGGSGKTKYTTYVLGDGAFELTDCGAAVPYEVDRNPEKNGGQDMLYSRQRKSFAPYGISFTMASMATMSPTNEELEMGANWELVNTNTGSGKKYIAHKMIPIAQIISFG